jgi:hypothetical protein
MRKNIQFSGSKILIICLELFAIGVIATINTQAVAQEKKLGIEQETLGQRYQQFENLLLQLSEHLRKTDPERADLLVRALGQSKHGRILSQMEQTSGLITKGQLGDAIDQQDELVKQLFNLLELLQSEDRQSELEKEKKRIRDLLKNVNRLISAEKGIRVASGRKVKSDQLLEKQKKVEKETDKLHQKIKQQDSKNSQEKSGSKSSGNKKGQGEKKKSSPENKQGGKGKPSEGQKKSGGKKSSGKNQGGKPSGKPSGKPDDKNEKSEPKTPGREQIKQAQEEMKKVLEELKKKSKKQAEKHQEEAIAKLQQAKERLEQILRQLREEEKELKLARLEARFQKMLVLQKQVYDGTLNLSSTKKEEWTSRHFGNARELTTQETNLILEANKALVILKEEGTSVAFPEAIEQLIDDMKIITNRIGKNDVGEFTRQVEKDVIEAIKELIEAFQNEIKKSKSKKKKKPGKSQQQQQKEESLIQQIAELKMFRALQMRINRRTLQIGKLIKGEQALDDDLVFQLQKLSTRQEKIQDATYGMATGRNR